MRLPTHLVPRAAKNLVPGYRNRRRRSYAALLSELRQAVPTLRFGESDGVPWLEPPQDGPRLHGFWTAAGDADLYDNLRPDLPPGLAREHFRLARDYLTRFRYPHLRPDLKPEGFAPEEMAGFHGQHKDAIADITDEAIRTELREAFRLKSGDVVIDCGAFLGFGDIRIAPELGDGRVYAVEASPDCYALLDRNVTHSGLGNIIPVARAIWNQETTLKLESSYAQASSLVTEVHKGDRTQAVPTISIDKLVETLEIEQVDMLSLTLNGAEVEALEGAGKTLSEYRPRIRLAGWYERGGRRIAEVTRDMLEGHRYRVIIGACGNTMAIPQ